MHFRLGEFSECQPFFIFIFELTRSEIRKCAENGDDFVKANFRVFLGDQLVNTIEASEIELIAGGGPVLDCNLSQNAQYLVKVVARDDIRFYIVATVDVFGCLLIAVDRLAVHVLAEEGASQLSGLLTCVFINRHFILDYFVCFVVNIESVC